MCIRDRGRGYLLLPLIILVGMVMKGFTMSRSAVIATFVAIAVSMVRKETRMDFNGFVAALENGAKNTISVAVACGIAGIIAGVVTMTGLCLLYTSQHFLWAVQKVVPTSIRTERATEKL